MEILVGGNDNKYLDCMCLLGNYCPFDCKKYTCGAYCAMKACGSGGKSTPYNLIKK